MECGINALSEYTMINREDRDMYAFTKMDIRNSEIKTDKKYGTYRIEIWRYDPKLLTHSEVVDKLSLYLSLVNHEDERVQIELENLIADIDIILVVEALSSEFVSKFWDFVKTAKYEQRNKGTNDGNERAHEYYRFIKPSDTDFPYQLELFSRKIGLLNFRVRQFPENSFWNN